MLRIQDGQFYNENNEVVPVEIGNTEQIRLLKEEQKRLEIIANSVPVKCFVDEDTDDPELTLKFKCPKCKEKNTHTFRCESATDLDNGAVCCTSCKDIIMFVHDAKTHSLRAYLETE